MLNMNRPVQQHRQVEYATKADFEVLAAEVRGLRESTDAQIQGFRKATDAQIQGFRESTDARQDAQSHALDRIERQIERMAVDHRATVRWIVGSALALGGLMLAMLRFGQTGVG